MQSKMDALMGRVNEAGKSDLEDKMVESKEAEEKEKTNWSRVETSRNVIP